MLGSKIQILYFYAILLLCFFISYAFMDDYSDNNYDGDTNTSIESEYNKESIQDANKKSSVLDSSNSGNSNLDSSNSDNSNLDSSVELKPTSKNIWEKWFGVKIDGYTSKIDRIKLDETQVEFLKKVDEAKRLSNNDDNFSDTTAKPTDLNSPTSSVRSISPNTDTMSPNTTTSSTDVLTPVRAEPFTPNTLSALDKEIANNATKVQEILDKKDINTPKLDELLDERRYLLGQYNNHLEATFRIARDTPINDIDLNKLKNDSDILKNRSRILSEMVESLKRYKGL
jgi:hypothetical protein